MLFTLSSFLISISTIISIASAAPTTTVYSYISQHSHFNKITTAPFNIEVVHNNTASAKHFLVPFLQHGKTMYGMEYFYPHGQFQILNGRLVYTNNNQLSFGSVGEYDIINGLEILNINGLQDNPAGVESRFGLRENRLTFDGTDNWYVCNIDGFDYGVLTMINKAGDNVPEYCEKVDLTMTSASH